MSKWIVTHIRKRLRGLKYFILFPFKYSPITISGRINSLNEVLMKDFSMWLKKWRSSYTSEFHVSFDTSFLCPQLEQKFPFTIALQFKHLVSLIVLAEVILKIAGNNYYAKFLYPIKYIRGKLNLINTKNSRKRLKKALKLPFWQY